MSSPYFVLHIPSKPNQPVTLPYLSHLPPPVGRKLPNGMTVVTDDTRPTLFFKFSPWNKALLAFDEVDAYSRLSDIDDISGIVQLYGVSGMTDHFVRIIERSHMGSLDRFLLDKAAGSAVSIDTESVRSIVAQIAGTMANIHSLNLVHRDLKAENILIFDEAADDGDGRTVKPKVSDFDRTIELPHGAFLEEPVGSLFHMAPELLAWQKYDRKIDVYAFGILMFEALHGGARPYTNVATSMPDSLSQSDFAKKVVSEELRPRWLHEDEALKRLAARCWATNPDERPEFQEIFEMLKPVTLRRTLLNQAAPGKHGRPRRRDIDNVGVASDIGKVRTRMEDAVCTLKTPGALVACLFDGFRGHRASEFAARQFPVVLLNELDNDTADAKVAMNNTFRRLDSSLRAIVPPIECGSTAVVALLRDHDLVVSWLGDSPAYLFRKGKDAKFSAVALIDKHHPSRDDEAARVVANGGVVDREKRWLDSGEEVPWGPLRVFAPKSSQKSGIAVSRSIGLFSFKPAIGDEPEMIQLERQDDDLFLVLGSDGVFDVLDTEAVYETVVAAPSAQHAADAIISAVLRNGAPDNASVVVVDMRKSHASAAATLSSPQEQWGS